MINKSSKILYPKLSYAITGAAFDVHNSIGRYAKEKTYSDALELVFKERGLSFQRENIITKTNERVDFLVNEEIIVEIKAKTVILKTDYYQTQRYLHALNKNLALLINFRNRYLKPIRVIKIGTPEQFTPVSYSYNSNN